MGNAPPPGDDRESGIRRGNFMARARMAVLYDHSVTWKGLVVGTGNKTETLIGYTTLWGDSACAFNPIGDLYKSQVRQLATAIGVPDAIIRKAPSADLWPGQTDEAEVGFSYAMVDRLLYWLVDRRRKPEELAAMGFDPELVERVERMVAGAEFKRQVPPIAKLGPRTAGIDYLYPRRRPGSTAHAVSAGPPPAGTLYVVATPIGNLGDITLRAIEVLRSVAVVAAEDTRLTRRLWARHEIQTQLVSYHARSPESRTEALLSRLAGGEDVALVSDAGTPLVSDPGEALVRHGRRAAAGWCRSPGPRPCCRRWLRAGSRRRAGGSRGSCRGAAPNVGSGSLESRPTIARRSCSRRPAGRPRRCETWPRRAARTVRPPSAGSSPSSTRRCGAATLGELAAAAVEDPPRGEVTIVVAGAPSGFQAPGPAGTLTADQAGAALDAARGQVDALVAAGQSRSSAARQVARESGLPRRELFAPGRRRT